MKLTPSDKCYRLNREFEKLRTSAYKVGKGPEWTIGYGATYYENGEKIKEGDIITADRAIELNRFQIGLFAYQASKCIFSDVSQTQFDSLVDFNFNTGKLCKSTLIKIVNADPNHPDINDMFLRWIYDEGKISDGIIRRRLSEIHLYRFGELKYDWSAMDIKSVRDKVNGNH